MNAMLMLDIADEIETHPERYNQALGSYLSNHEHCPACVAVTALRLRSEAFMGRGWYSIAASARKSLDLTKSQAGALFSGRPNPVNLQKSFPWVTTAELDEIGELANWTGKGRRLRPVTAPETPPPASFNFFWAADVDGTDIVRWRRSSAVVMAATLRLIARGPGD